MFLRDEHHMYHNYKKCCFSCITKHHCGSPIPRTVKSGSSSKFHAEIYARTWEGIALLACSVIAGHDFEIVPLIAE